MSTGPSSINLTFVRHYDYAPLLGAVIGFPKAIILVVLMHIILGAVLAPGNQMLRSCLTCDVLNGAADTTRDFIRNDDVRKFLIQKKPAISIDAVKEYLAPSREASPPPPKTK